MLRWIFTLYSNPIFKIRSLGATLYNSLDCINYIYIDSDIRYLHFYYNLLIIIIKDFIQAFNMIIRNEVCDNI